MFAALTILQEIEMSSEDVRSKLAELRLRGMSAAYELQISSRAFDNFSRDEIIVHLATGEIQIRNDRAQARLHRTANLKHKFAEPEDIVFSPERGFEKKKLPSFSPQIGSNARKICLSLALRALANHGSAVPLQIR
jgi:hypothetical protein